jgi:hypothetical protein
LEDWNRKESEMQVEDKRACPSCGTDNAAASSYCWKCFANIPTADGQPYASRPGMPNPPEAASQIGSPWLRPGLPTEIPAPVPAQPPKRSKALSTIVSVVVGAVAVFGVRTLLDGGAPALPDTIAGSPRMTDGMAQSFEDEMAKQAGTFGLDVAAGIYGSSAPEFFVILVDDAAAETTDQLFDSFVSGMSQAGASVDTNAGQSGPLGDAEFRCVPVSAPGVNAGACMWRSESDVGIVLQLNGGVGDTRELLTTVHAAVSS